METKPMQELLNGQIGAEKTNTPNKQLVSREPLHGTPFEIIGAVEVGYFLALGKYKLTEHYDTREEVLDILIQDSWLIIANMIALMIDIKQKEVEDDNMAAMHRTAVEGNKNKEIN